MGKRRERRQRHRPKEEENILNVEEKEEVVKSKSIKHEISRTGFVGKLENIYVNHYKKLLLIPIILLVLALAQIGGQYALTGDFLHKGVSLQGGVTVTIPTIDIIDLDELNTFLLTNLPEYDVSVRKLATATGAQSGVIIEADITDNDVVDSLNLLLEERLGVDKSEFSVEMMGSSLGSSFFKQTMIALLLAFLFMGIVVFLYFRIPIPSLAVILAAFSDIVVTLAIVNVLGIKLSTAGIAAFLMLIGYSVDTDMLLTIRVLKKKEGTIMDRVYDALKTGIVMNLTTMAAVVVALVLSQSDVLTQIMTILLIGLFVDIINTWIQNVGILRLYLEWKEGREK